MKCEYGRLVEWYWQGKTDILGDTPVLVLHHNFHTDRPGIEPSPSKAEIEYWPGLELQPHSQHHARLVLLFDRLWYSVCVCV
jgi:hypothetical protein